MLLYLLLTYFVYSLSYGHNFDTVQLRDINLNDCKILKSGVERGARRSVYVGDNFFYKIWDKHFWRSRFFIAALEMGFYDENNTPLVAVIYDKDACCGYITRKGEIRSDIQTKGRILPTSAQSDQDFLDFYQDLMDKTRKFRWVYIDYAGYNIVYESGKFRIVDLEPILPIESVPGSFFRDPLYQQEYRSFIRKLKSGKK